MTVAAGISPREGVITSVAAPPAGARPNRSAYVSLPRKYRPLRKENASPSVNAPDRSRTARATSDPSRKRIFARRPPQKAGDSRKMRCAPMDPNITRASRSRKYAREIVGDGHVELIEPAAPRRLVGAPAHEHGRVPEPASLQMVVFHFADALEPHGLPRQILA